MIKILEKIYKYTPHCIQNIFVTGYNIYAYRVRYCGNYSLYKNQLKKNETLSLIELKLIQLDKLLDLFSYAKKKSSFYKAHYSNFEIHSLDDIKQLPIIDKETLRVNLESFYTVARKEANISKTGGTTGKSLEVYEIKDNTQFGFALLDNFRGKYGYKLGKRTAWFSGKDLLTNRDVKNNIFWKTDYLYNVRYYSTFHIHPNNLSHYIDNLIKFRPEFLVGFPSTMNDIAIHGSKNNINFPENVIRAIFPTAETLTQEMRFNIETFFKSKAYNQYASSEGAPFIFECTEGNLHMELQSGVFEVLDENNNDTKAGRLIVTSFTSYGTPLIRYDIGDGISLKEGCCACGNNNPLVEEIRGRINDYIFSEETGKINLGNISNCLKGVKGVVKFQVLQKEKSAIEILLVKDETFTKNDELEFLNNFRQRVGTKMIIDILYCANIDTEKSGKFRMVKNSL